MVTNQKTIKITGAHCVSRCRQRATVILVSLVLSSGGAFAKGKPIDLVLTETLVPSSGDVIDCRGGTIKPAQPAVYDAAFSRYASSVPDTLIYLKDVHRVRIKNCTITDATFGIYVVGGGGHKFIHNTISAKGIGISLHDSDRNKIENNVISAVNVGIQVSDDSDRTVISRNELTALTPADTALFPGNEWLFGYWGYMIATWANYTGVTNVVVNGELHQVPTRKYNFTDDTRVSNNTIHNENGNRGIGFAVRSRNSIARKNTVYGGNVALLAAGYGPDELVKLVLPGHCSDEATRYCSSDADCDILGYDPAPLGECLDIEEFPSVAETWQSRRVGSPSFVGNTVHNAFLGVAIGWPEKSHRVENNDLIDNCIGIEIGNYGLEMGKVRGNIVASKDDCGLGFGIGLSIWNLVLPGLDVVDSIGVDVSYNDFGSNPKPFDAAEVNPAGPVIIAPYTLLTILPMNWWGESGFPANSIQWPNTTDPAPSAEPIADSYRNNRGGEDD